MGNVLAWREALPYSDDYLPAVFLAEARHREGLTQAQVAQATGIPRRHISEMEHNKRAIGWQNARKLAEALKVTCVGCWWFGPTACFCWLITVT